MRHNVDGRKFGRNTSHRTAMFRNMANSVIKQEQIVTTVEKAKEARRVVDRLVTLSKQDTLHSRRLAFDRTRDRAVVTKLFGELAKRYSKRPGGYTRVLKLSDRRWGDAAEMAILELVDHPPIERGKKPKTEEQLKAAAEKSAAAAQTTDPLKGFKKMLGGGRRGGAEGKAKGAQSVKGAKAPKSASRKTSAGGGKSGGGE